ncbi:MAG TPA: LuxR C-terminal-related transcriptional regulator [Thermomicrobiales bacterium]|nr:LuxR C-terminal-related transcriptional regulator [Thermomicrobiales bacterium]
MANMSAPLSSFVGRDAEIAQIVRLLTSTRLLTLTGPGGVGKTRLALAVVAAIEPDMRDGAVVVSLGAVTDPALVGSAVEAALGLAEQGGRSPVEVVVAHLADKELLLVLDNFEQIVDAAPLVATLLHAAQGLRALVTSRVTLRIGGEQELIVQPLALPDPDSPASTQQLLEYEAIALFEQRARESRIDFQLTPENASAVVEICRRLDGLPLAIELAAARVKLLSPAALLERLDRRLPLLTGGARDLPARQQTMRGAITWSYDLLSPDEQRLLRQLSVFTGGWTLDAAEAVCQLGAGGSEVFDGLASLADKSLLRQTTQRDKQTEAGRFSLLGIVRDFGLELLEEFDEADETRQRHAAHYLELAETAAPQLESPDATPWLIVLDAEHGNLLAALDWLLRQRAAERGLRLVGALREFWFMRGRLAEGMTRTQALLALPEATPRTRARARALATAAWLARWLGDTTRSIEYCVEALAIWGEIGDHAHDAWLYNLTGMCMQASIRERGDLLLANEYFNRSLRLAREVGDSRTLGMVLNNLGINAQANDELELATEMFEEALSVTAASGHKGVLALAKNGRGRLALLQGDHRLAQTLFRESLELSRDVRNTWGIALAIGKQAIMAQIAHDAQRAARLFGACDALHARISTPMSGFQQQDHAPALAASRTALGDDAFEAAWAEGAAMSLEHAVAYALEPPATPEPDAAGAHMGLTPRELDVLRLVATGLTDAEVAEQLFLSRRTVSSHLTSIYTKLGVSSRAAATRYAVDHELV